jgi:hypothetical protein
MADARLAWFVVMVASLASPGHARGQSAPAASPIVGTWLPASSSIPHQGT